MVLHHVRIIVHGEPGTNLNGVPDRADGAPLAARADGGDPHATASARSGKIPARTSDGLGILLVLAVPDRLGRKSSGGDSVVRGAAESRMAVCRTAARDRPFCSSLRAPAFTRSETEFQTALADRSVHPVHAAGGPFLAGRSGVP